MEFYEKKPDRKLSEEELEARRIEMDDTIKKALKEIKKSVEDANGDLKGVINKVCKMEPSDGLIVDTKQAMLATHALKDSTVLFIGDTRGLKMGLIINTGGIGMFTLDNMQGDIVDYVGKKEDLKKPTIMEDFEKGDKEDEGE